MKLRLAKLAKRPRLENRTILMRALREAAEHIGLAAAMAAENDDEVHIVIVNERRMAALNEQFLGHEGSTDVLAFSMMEDVLLPEDAGPQVLGEVYLCLDVAVSAAKRYGSGLGEECLLYAVHGMLHLAGMDDRDSRQRRAMKAAERRVMAVLRERFPLAAIFGW